MPDLSIVSSLFNSEPFIRPFYERVKQILLPLGLSYEILFVNDGSPDDSLAAAVSIQKEDPTVRVIDLSSNFGHHKAMMTGLMESRGEKVVLIDVDLEEPPELLIELLERQQTTGADVVYGVQIERKGRLFERISGALYYWAFNLLSTHSVPPNLCTLRLMTRRYVDALIQHKEREVCISGLWAVTGFSQVPFPFVKGFRGGKSSYTLPLRIHNFVNWITSFSNRPLFLIFYLGCFTLTLSCLAGCYLIIRHLFFGAYLSGWASLIVSLWFIGGSMMFGIGILGLYLAKIYSETKQRPYTIIRQRFETRT